MLSEAQCSASHGEDVGTGCEHGVVSDASLWPDPPPPAPWVLHDGGATVQRDSDSIDGRALVWFTIREKPTVRYDFTSESPDAIHLFFNAGDESEFAVAAGIRTELVTGGEGEKSSGWSSNRATSGFRMQGDADDLVGGDGSTLDLLRFHLVNFGEKDERTPRMFDVDGWTVRIAATGSSPTLNGFAVTHVLDLVRSDSSTFGVDDARAARGWLFDALTFATGRIVGFALAQGYRNGTPVFLEAKCTKADAWKTRRSWWDQRCLDDADLAELCTRWAATSQDERTKSLLRRAAGSYATALAPEPLDTAVPIAGIGVELMVWELVHQRDQLRSTVEFDGLSFASRVRLALRSAGVSADLPEECSALRAHVARAELSDGPYAFTDVRNRLVHPPKKKRGWPPSDVMTEAWMLGVEYLALLILAALGYEGRYRSQFDYSGWRGTEVPVPWSPPPLATTGELPDTVEAAPEASPHAG